MSKFAVRTEQFSMYKYGAATLILFLSLASALSYAMPEKNDWDEGHVEIIHSLLETYNTNDPKAI